MINLTILIGLLVITNCFSREAIPTSRYKTNSDGILVNPAAIAWATNETAWSGGINWGAPATNGVCVGVQQFPEPMSGKLNVGIYFKNLKNEWHTFIMPAENLSFRVELADTDGNTVQRTSLGKQLLGKIPDLPETITKRGRSLKRIYVRNFEVLLHDQINLLDYFVIPKSGKYHLQFELQLQEFQNSSNHLTLATSIFPKCQTEIIVAPQ